MNIMLIGSADLSGKKIGGQYEKTRLIYNFLDKETDIDINFCNMLDIGKTLGLLSAILKGYNKCDCVVVITSTRGTMVISRLFYYLRKLEHKPIVYLIVGDQQNFLKSLPKRIVLCMDKLYFEVASMQDELKDKYNVGFFSNCKDIRSPLGKYINTKPIKICYYSEISYRKGFDRIVRALDVLNNEAVKYEMDVFGFFASDEVDMKKYFDTRPFLKFKGVIKREKAQDILSKYYFMVFPSRHKLEGVPGAIVDAYESGLPVVCSDIGFLSQVVKDKETGYIFKNEKQLIEILLLLYDNPNMVENLRSSVLQEVKKYDIKVAVKRLHNDLMELISNRCN